LYDSCIDAFKILLRFRTHQGLKYNDSGRFIHLDTLNKGDRLKLKGCFKPVKDIQELLRIRFKLSQMM
jgi:CBS domain-containing protein